MIIKDGRVGLEEAVDELEVFKEGGTLFNDGIVRLRVVMLKLFKM